MDLGTIRRRLFSREYSSVSQFADHLRLVWYGAFIRFVPIFHVAYAVFQV